MAVAPAPNQAAAPLSVRHYLTERREPHRRSQYRWREP